MKKFRSMLIIGILTLILSINTGQNLKADSLDDYTEDGWTVVEIGAGTGMFRATKTDIYLDIYDFILTNSAHTSLDGMEEKISVGGQWLYSNIKHYDSSSGELLKKTKLGDVFGVSPQGHIQTGIKLMDNTTFGVSDPLDNYKVSFEIYIDGTYYQDTAAFRVDRYMKDNFGMYETDGLWNLALTGDGESEAIYLEGFNDGKSEGIIEGTEAGDSAGYTRGYDEGIIEGKDIGYAEGYEATEGESAILQVAGGIIGAVLSFGLFIGTEFAIFGVSLLDVIIMLIILGAVIFVLKLVF
jgi:hypothetical protein